MELAKRKKIRLNEYDYSSNGMYFITICSYQRDYIFGEIIDNTETVGQGLCSCLSSCSSLCKSYCGLSKVGEIIKKEILDLNNRYPNIKIDKYVIMPNHVHLIIIIENTDEDNRQNNRQDNSQDNRQEQSPCPTIGDIVCALKSISTKKANVEEILPGRKIWQYRFHDHIIRKEEVYQKIWKYIDENPSLWKEDRFYNKLTNTTKGY